MQILRLEQFREGKVGFVSAGVSDETNIDIRPDTSGEAVTPNLDHFCLVLGPTDMIAKGASAEEEVRPAWGTQGYGEQLNIERDGRPRSPHLGLLFGYWEPDLCCCTAALIWSTVTVLPERESSHLSPSCNSLP